MHRYTSLFGALLLALLLAPAVAAEAAATQTPPRPQISAEILIKTARAALAKGKLDDAELLLKGVKPGEGNIDDLDFLHGTIALARRNWQDAIARFRAMLARNPDLPRVRLDLALAYFQAGEDGNAAYHFRLALGTKDLARHRACAGAFLSRPDQAAQGLVGHRIGGGAAGQQYQRGDQRPAGGPLRVFRRAFPRMRVRPAA